MPKYLIRQVSPTQWEWFCRDAKHGEQSGTGQSLRAAIEALMLTARRVQGRVIRFDDIQIERTDRATLTAQPTVEDKWLSECSLEELLAEIEKRVPSCIYMMRVPVNPDDVPGPLGKDENGFRLAWNICGNIPDASFLFSILEARFHLLLNGQFPMYPEEESNGDNTPPQPT